MYENPRQSYIPDSTPWILDSRYWIPDSLFVELGSRIPIVGGIRIPWAVFGIPHSKAQDFWFHKQKFPGFRIPLHEVTKQMTPQSL